MEKILFPINIEVETSAGPRGEHRESYLLVTFKIEGGGHEQYCKLKIDFDVEFAASLEEAMRVKDGIRMVVG